MRNRRSPISTQPSPSCAVCSPRSTCRSRPPAKTSPPRSRRRKPRSSVSTPLRQAPSISSRRRAGWVTRECRPCKNWATRRNPCAAWPTSSNAIPMPSSSAKNRRLEFISKEGRKNEHRHNENRHPLFVPRLPCPPTCPTQPCLPSEALAKARRNWKPWRRRMPAGFCLLAFLHRLLATRGEIGHGALLRAAVGGRGSATEILRAAHRLVPGAAAGLFEAAFHGCPRGRERDFLPRRG